MHAALIVSELLKPHLKEGTQLSLTDFMFEHKGDRDVRARRKLLATLTAISKKPKP